MRADSARWIVLFVLGLLAAGCQSAPRWDWWRSAKSTSPSNSALAAAPYQPSLPSATAQPPAAMQPGGTAGNPYGGLVSRPASAYPTGAPTAGATLSAAPPAGGYPMPGNVAAQTAWPPSGAAASTGAATAYPNTGYPATNGSLAAAAAPPTTQPQITYPSPPPSGTMAPQAGPYSGQYSGTGGAVAKAPASEPALGSRYAGDSSTGDRYASNPNTASRYDVTSATPPTQGATAPPAGDRYKQPAAVDRYNAQAGYVGTAGAGNDRYAQAPAGGTNLAPSSDSAQTPVNTATADRYGSGVGTQPAPGVNRYVVPSSDPYPPAEQPTAPAGQPAAAERDSGEYMPGSIKRYTPPGSANAIDQGSSTSAAVDARYPAASFYPPSNGYPQTATPAAPAYHSYPAQR